LHPDFVSCHGVITERTVKWANFEPAEVILTPLQSCRRVGILAWPSSKGHRYAVGALPELSCRVHRPIHWGLKFAVWYRQRRPFDLGGMYQRIVGQGNVCHTSYLCKCRAFRLSHSLFRLHVDRYPRIELRALARSLFIDGPWRLPAMNQSPR
jgi:hypothetical protein